MIDKKSYNKGYVEGWEDAVKALNRHMKNISGALVDGVKEGMKVDK